MCISSSDMVSWIAVEHIGRYECMAHIGGGNFYVQY